MKNITTLVRYVHNRIIYVKHKILSNKSVIIGSDDIKYHIIPGSSLDYIIEQEGFLDDWKILKNLATSIPKDGVIFDVGANVGHLSLPFAKKLVPKGKVFAYEPDPENFKQLTRNIKLNNFENITPIEVALQNNDTLSSTDFHIRRTIDGDGNQNKGLSSLKNISKFTKHKITVKVSTLDKEVQLRNITRVDFIKIDVEGAEYLVLQGAKKILNNFKPIIQYEYSNILDKLMNENNTSTTFEHLKKLGYRQFYVNLKGQVIELTSPDHSMSDVNVVCFHGNKIPEFFLKNQ